MSKTKTKLKNQLKTAKQDLLDFAEFFGNETTELRRDSRLLRLRLQHTEEVCKKRTESVEYWQEVAQKACKDRSDFFRENCKLERNLELWRVLAIVSSIGFLILLAQ